MSEPLPAAAQAEASDSRVAEDERRSAFRQGLLAAIPKLRAFALSLAAHADHADDLVQETLMKAWNHQHGFQEGTNLKAWLFTILRNEYFSQLRKRKREVEDADGGYAAGVMTPAGQESQLDMSDLRLALQQLPDDQREAVVLVGASGFSYQEVAEICHVPVGTVKSRVNRARHKLAVLLGHAPTLRAGDEDPSEHK
ncbi:RNA polymerase subunit sigma [Aestuariivirga litoralis]|uniref:RNA polymerase sigma factor n=1 Tax=Aestuariivirga litoralis TaxID=2650924 RepID=A0A2W2AT49_9HYPH|nr:sigma-70 family RNA polymerase sigma factor [Aestuariivirga litoralis]PZF75710.1 RNA polymerase subunit sigma [Aestuariivirga litoralis]